MVKINKKTLYFIILFSIFFIGINKVNALECEYYLPFSGIDASGNYVEPDDNMKCYQNSGMRECSIKANLNSEFTPTYKCEKYAFYAGILEMDWGDILTPAGYSVGATAGKVKNAQYYKTYAYKMLGTNGNETDEKKVSTGVKTVIQADKKCPKYIVVQKKDNNIFKQKSKFYEELSSDHEDFPCLAGSSDNIVKPISHDSRNNFQQVETEDNYYMIYKSTEDDKVYRTYLKSFYKISGSKKGNGSVSISDFSSDYYILPYRSKQYHGEKEIAQVEDAKDAARVYVETFDSVWYKKMVNYHKKLESDCGKDWFNYINLKNFDFTGSSKLFDYAEGTYNKNNLQNNDKNISKQCWNTRSDFFKAFESMQLFMYGMGANTVTVFESISNIDEDTIEDYIKTLESVSITEAEHQNLYYRVYLEDDTRINHFKYLLSFFEGVKIGTSFTPEVFKSSTNKLVEKKDAIRYKKKVLMADQCAYKCSRIEDPDSYNTCKDKNQSYKDCINALKACGAKVCTDCIDKDYESDDYKNCINGCSRVDSSCMESKGVKDFLKESQAALDKVDKTIEDLDKASEYTYEPVSLPIITWESSEYEPECKDVKVITWLWSIVTLLAPFLLIIFASFDYFKAVMASDEENIKKAKKKAPLRLVAFILLIIVPVLIKFIAGKFGTNRANNLTYLRCIVTGDTGE